MKYKNEYELMNDLDALVEMSKSLGGGLNELNHISVWASQEAKDQSDICSKARENINNLINKIVDHMKD